MNFPTRARKPFTTAALRVKGKRRQMRNEKWKMEISRAPVYRPPGWQPAVGPLLQSGSCSQPCWGPIWLGVYFVLGVGEGAEPATREPLICQPARVRAAETGADGTLLQGQTAGRRI